ncbi:MAG: hypothetical protein AAFW68_10360 [Pseudomonadota bacterium]
MRLLLVSLMAFGLFGLAGQGALSRQNAPADDPAALIKQFEGRWASDGKAFGASAQSEMIWAYALDDKFMRLDYRIEMTREGGEASVFQGAAFYRLSDSAKLRAFWADNSGDLHPVSAEHDGSAIVSHWGEDGGKQGRTRYELLGSGDMMVTDWIRTPEGWRQFNRNVFTRSSAD